MSRRRSDSRGRSRDRRGRRSRSRHYVSRSRSANARGRNGGRTLFDDAPEGMPVAPQVNIINPREVRTLNIPHQAVGSVIGPQGRTLATIEKQTGCYISIDQSTQSQGYSVVNLSGANSMCVDTAAALIQQAANKYETHPANFVGKGGNEEFAIEQKMIGIIVGTNGETIKAIKQQTNTWIGIDKATDGSDLAIVKVKGDPEAVACAKQLINQKMMELNLKEGNFAQYSICIEQHHVAMFIGKGGDTVKLLKAQSGADVQVDQTTQARGYSTIRIGAHPGADIAKKLIDERLQEVRKYQGKLAKAGVRVDGGIAEHPGPYIPTVMPAEVLRNHAAQLGVPLQPAEMQGIPAASATASKPRVSKWGDEELPEMYKWETHAAPQSYTPSQIQLQPATQIQPKPTGLVRPTGLVKPTGLVQPTGLVTPAVAGQQNASAKVPVTRIPPKATGLVKPGKAPGFQTGLVIGSQPTSVQPNAAYSEPSPVGVGLPTPAGLPAQSPGHNIDSMEDAYRVDQRFMGWVMGKDGETLRQIMTMSGAQVDVADDPNDKGSRIIRVKNPASPQAQSALQMITEKIRECMNMPMIRQMLGESLPPPMVKLPA
eukprot:gnl/MRDRNA2_/MRDRNA2_153718_c0_seq1.p1 gnl/MRDRNA2_/MRDRNA2_153718_c0~~gnl/MRDRNA2_/MRDRNA2_153718_c0_seq1.p1  ORF type:complete len:599 (-),score=85.34 gnl/MRDRNA2_/MRDRNA2_153718_c0_seq1:50-1846(-)